METLAVVGPSLAALSAARAVRAQGFTGRLVIIGDEPQRPSGQRPLSRDFLPGALTAVDLCLECDTDDLQAEWLLDGGAALLGASTWAITVRDGTTVQADAVVIATDASARPLPALAGICDAMGCTNIPGLVAVDDCAAWFDPAAGTDRRVEHWTGALERAAWAVRALLDPGAPEEQINLPASGPASTASSCSSRDTPPVTTASRSRLATRRPTASLPLTAAARSPWLSSA